MEDVLDVYELPYNPAVPVICMDERPYQLLGEARDSWAMRPGDDKKVDSEYTRNGACSIFAFIEPLGGMHHVRCKGTPDSNRLGRGNKISDRCPVS